MFVNSNIESILAYSCAPCLAGLKPANLVSIPMVIYEQISSVDMFFLNSKGFFIKELCKCKKCVQIFLYNEQKLQHLFSQDKIRQALTEFKYPPNSYSIDKMLELLKKRMCKNSEVFGCKRKESFPHEIGIFLGYPVEDVLEYYKRNGKGYIFSGYWKVYSNPKKAAETFSRYNECKELFALQIQQGLRLYDLLSA